MDIYSQVTSERDPVLNNSKEDFFIIIHLLLKTRVSLSYSDYNNYLIFNKDFENNELVSIIGNNKKDYTDEDPKKILLLSKMQTLYQALRYDEIRKHLLPNHQFWQNKLLKDAKNKFFEDTQNIHCELEKKNAYFKNFFQRLKVNNAQDIVMVSAEEALEFWYTVIVLLIADSKIKAEYEYEIKTEIQTSMLIIDIKNFVNISQNPEFENLNTKIDILSHDRNSKIKNLIDNLILAHNSEEEKLRINDLTTNFSKISSIILNKTFIRFFENQKTYLIVKQYLTIIDNTLNSRILLLTYLSNSLSHQQIDIIIDKMIHPIIKESFSQILYIYDFLASDKLRNRDIILINMSEHIENLLPIIITRLFCYKKLYEKFEEYSFSIIKNNFHESKFYDLSNEEIMRYIEIDSDNLQKILSDFIESICDDSYFDSIAKIIAETTKHSSLLNNIMQNILVDHNRFLNLIDPPKLIKLVQNNYKANISTYSSSIQKSKYLEKELPQNYGVNIIMNQSKYGLDIQKWSLLDPLSEIFKELDIDTEKLSETNISILNNLVSKDFSEKDLMQSLYELIVNSSHGIDDDGIKIIKSCTHKKHHHKLAAILSSKITLLLSTTHIDVTKLFTTYYSQQIKKTLLRNKIFLDIKKNDCLIKIFFNNISLSPNQKSNLLFLGWIFLAFIIPYFKHKDIVIHTILAISIVIIASKLTYQYFLSIQNHNLSINLADITKNHISIAKIENANNSSVKLH